MKEVSFDDIFILGNTVVDNKHYKHVHYPEMLIRYDSNFLDFKVLPTVKEFVAIESYLRSYHIERGQNHLKFSLPENKKMSEPFETYLTKNGYEISCLELYAIEPKNFPQINRNSEIDVQFLTEDHLEQLINIKYENDLEYGEAFARQKTQQIKKQFSDPKIQQVIAFYQGEAVGYVDLILSNHTVEIDELSVHTKHQNKGIGSHIQRFVMDQYLDKKIILVADAEDTPREMYRKQNYEYLGFKYEFLKTEQ
ncbi:GNAT family N-acetyltransferase [Enterococcus sp.]|uniref:GNAT family N-acetyltransferase n=1 Tax=Enterococcus sp. TaxID=35783 RepID=UPI002FC973CC